MATQFGTARLADGREVPYRVFGEDGPWILHTRAFGGPVDLLDNDPMYDRFLTTLASAGQLLAYDRLGTGSADPLDPDRDAFEQWIESSAAVLDTVGADAAWMVGSAVSLIAEMVRTERQRVLGVVAINGMTRRSTRLTLDARATGDPLGPLDWVRLVTPSRDDDPSFLHWLERGRRLGPSRNEMSGRFEADVAAVASFVEGSGAIVDAPPTMLIRRRGAMSDGEFEWWHGIFPDAECVTLEGADAGEFGLDAGLLAELAVGFITGTPIAAPAQRKLVAVLFIDLVESTSAAAASGDTVWRSTLDRYEAALQRTIQRHHGTVVKHTGDGALATFPSGSEAIDAAIALRNTTRDLGLEGRAGIHVGEVEQRGDDIGGIAVNLAARVLGEAGPGEIVVTSTVEQASLGSPFDFNDLGARSLKGIDRPWHLYAAEPRSAR